MTQTSDIATPIEDSPKRQQILAGARHMFLTNGFEAASMQDIARAAGVSKGTLYVYFDSKETMFEALVLCECCRMQEVMRQIGAGGGSAEDQLRAIARQMVNRLLQCEVLSAMRMVIGTGEKFPELARKVYEAGPMRSAHTLAEYLEKHVESGELRIADCRAASAEFIDLVISGQQRRALLMMPQMPDDEVERYINRRVALFLTAYRAA